jgi:hypothetical protein
VAASARVFVFQWLARTALLLFWSLAAWGVLLLALTLVGAVSEGPARALARLLPERGASLWAWMNAVSVGLAVAVALVGGGLFWAGRRGTPSPPET